MQEGLRARAEGLLFTDQYELTMAQLYFHQGIHQMPSAFDYFYRSNPDYGEHRSGFTVFAGMAWLLDWIESAAPSDADLDWLRGQRGRGGEAVFDEVFLAWLKSDGLFAGLTIEAIPEGRVVHPNVPLAIVSGPLAAAQMLETSLLNHLNYPTLVATKAARIRESGRGQLLLEFGLRRAQGRGASAGARAALIGGADFSSYVGLSHAVGLAPKGTHAHSMVQAFMALGGGELDAFRAYADDYPDDCLLLVDTINTLESGIPNAIRVFEELKRSGHQPVGIRLDSGDLAHLSVQAARMLNDAGFEDTSIVLSNNLDEMVVWQILTQIAQEAPAYDLDPDHVIGRLAFGVGTRLITSWGEPALGGVYKLTSLEQGGEWRPAIKVSESQKKTPNPGRKRPWRLYDRRGLATADLVALADEDPSTLDPVRLHHPIDPGRQRWLPQEEISQIEPLLASAFAGGERRTGPADLETLRGRRQADIERLDPGVRRLLNPHIYHVSLSHKLWQLRSDLIRDALQSAGAGG
jgi:nicotinate phosphoribosyltransferase